MHQYKFFDDREYTAEKTLFPKYFLFVTSLFSNASYEPVDAPEGQIAFEETFPQNISVSIVGMPLLSNICLETTFVIFDIK